ncbi:azurin [Luteimonas sp. FCS-9]|uniref:azurin n=1 Tax=Luteimonas sp. FCS-9 TaxID=1547516 RepID=UPI00063EB222|nr:azurin [Luteimonas sp. FCS-9]KLJ01094.1 electron transfer flavoprotein [Luteimonas sp. FCS-9]
MNTRTMLLGLALLGAAGMAHAAPNCTVSLKGNDQMQFDQKTATVSASCRTVTIELAHTGKLPAAAMGHNVVVTATPDADAVARDGIKAGAAADYIQAGDKRVLAHTKLIGGGQTATITLPGSALKAGGDYTYFCSFPGHSAIMRGKLVVQP